MSDHDGATVLRRMTPTAGRTALRFAAIAALITCCAAIDVKISKGLGAHGYDSIRLSIVDQNASSRYTDGFFTYSAPFRLKWTQNALHTALVHAAPGNRTVFDVGGSVGQVSVSLPADASRLPARLKASAVTPFL